MKYDHHSHSVLHYSTKRVGKQGQEVKDLSNDCSHENLEDDMTPFPHPHAAHVETILPL